jgi:hypothetical protein
MAVAVTALVVALGGAGVAATGGSFILRQLNSASSPSRLTSNVNGRSPGIRSKLKENKFCIRITSEISIGVIVDFNSRLFGRRPVY